MLFGCDNCYQFGDSSTTSVKIGLAVLAVVLLLAFGALAVRAWSRRGAALAGTGGLMVARVLVAGSVVPQLIDLDRTIAGPFPKVFCGTPAMGPFNDSFAEADAHPGRGDAARACLEGFAERRFLSYGLLGLAGVVAVASVSVGRRGRGGAITARPALA